MLVILLSSGNAYGNSLSPKRVILFIWKCLNEAIQVCEKNLSHSEECPICTLSEESIKHALF